MLEQFDIEAVVRRQREEFEAARPQRVAFFRSHILPTYVDQWPLELHALSVPTVAEYFPVDAYERAHDRESPMIFIEPMTEILDRMAERIYPAFFRLASRSPKDWWYGHELVGEDRGATQPRNAPLRDVAWAFFMSERTSKDVFDAKDADYTPVLCARQWVDGIEPHREFRCFMRNRELAGVSVYRAWEEQAHHDIVADPQRWHAAITAWFPRFREAAPLDDLVFDVVVRHDDVLLLEINPFLDSTYPGHFLGKPLDGRFRYIGDGDSVPVQ